MQVARVQGFIPLSYVRAAVRLPHVSQATGQMQPLSVVHVWRAQAELHRVTFPPSSEVQTELLEDETLSQLAEAMRPMTMTSQSEARLRSLASSAPRASHSRRPAERESQDLCTLRTSNRCSKPSTTRS